MGLTSNATGPALTPPTDAGVNNTSLRIITQYDVTRDVMYTRLDVLTDVVVERGQEKRLLRKGTQFCAGFYSTAPGQPGTYEQSESYRLIHPAGVPHCYEIGADKEALIGALEFLMEKLKASRKAPVV